MFFMVRPLATFCFWLLSILIHISIKKIVEKLKKNKHRFMVLIMLRESSCFCSSLPENCLFFKSRPRRIEINFFLLFHFVYVSGWVRFASIFTKEKMEKKLFLCLCLFGIYIVWHIHCWFSYVITWNCLEVMEWNIRNSTHKKYRLKELEIAIDTLLVG